MKMARRNKTGTISNSADAMVQALVDSTKGPPAVPAHVSLRDGDGPFWDGIVCARGRDEWTAADLVVAAQLARCQRDIEIEQVSLDGEGTVLRNERGTMVANPRVAVLEQLARREMALMRSLRMGGYVKGEAPNESGRTKLQRQASKLRGELEDEELLAS